MKPTSIQYIKENPIKALIIIILLCPIVILAPFVLFSYAILKGLIAVGKLYIERNS
jgi:hypothetical protein